MGRGSGESERGEDASLPTSSLGNARVLESGPEDDHILEDHQRTDPSRGQTLKASSACLAGRVGLAARNLGARILG